MMAHSGLRRLPILLKFNAIIYEESEKQISKNLLLSLGNSY